MLPVEGIAGQDEDDDMVFGIVLHAQRRESFRSAQGAQGEDRSCSTAPILPKGVKIVPYYDRTWLIDTTLHTVFQEPRRGRDAGDVRVVAFSRQLPRGGHRGGHDSACRCWRRSSG